MGAPVGAIRTRRNKPDMLEPQHSVVPNQGAPRGRPFLALRARPFMKSDSLEPTSRSAKSPFPSKPDGWDLASASDRKGTLSQPGRIHHIPPPNGEGKCRRCAGGRIEDKVPKLRRTGRKRVYEPQGLGLYPLDIHSRTTGIRPEFRLESDFLPYSIRLADPHVGVQAVRLGLSKPGRTQCTPPRRSSSSRSTSRLACRFAVPDIQSWMVSENHSSDRSNRSVSAQRA